MTLKFHSVACPICETGELVPFSDGVFTFRHGKKTYNVPGQHYAECNECGTSGYLQNQRKINSELITEFQEGLEDYISPSDILGVRERYSLTQTQATKIFKGGAKGFSKWERGEVSPCGATAMLLKVALESVDAMKQMARIAGADFPIVDAKPDILELSHLVSASKSEYLMIQCTHSEYSDDFVERNDVCYDNERVGIWAAEKQEDIKRSMQ